MRLLRREFDSEAERNAIVEKIKQQIRTNREASGNIFVRAELAEVLCLINMIQEGA